MTQSEVILKLRDSVQGYAILSEMTLDVILPVEIREKRCGEALQLLQSFLSGQKNLQKDKARPTEENFLDSAGARHSKNQALLLV